MRNKIIIQLIIFIFSSVIYTQEVQEQTEQKIELPKMYLEQKLDRAVMNWTAIMTGSIAYIKTLGVTPEAYGEYMGNIFAPGWEGSKGRSIPRFIETMYKNYQSDLNCRWEILSESEKSVKVKMNRFGDAILKDFADTGVTTEEYDRFFGKLMEVITNYLGFDYKQELEGDWIVFTVSEK